MRQNPLKKLTLSNRYYLMRHGESTANRRGIIVSHAENAIHDYGLTTAGVSQVVDAAMTTRLNIDTIIVSSDFRRARETAEIMQKVVDTKAPIVFTESLRERNFGDWELRDDQNYETIWNNDVAYPSQAIANVETTDAVATRISGLLSELEAQYQNETLLLVGHGDVLQITLALQHSIDPRFHRSLTHMANAEIRNLSQLSTDNLKLA